MSLQFKVLIDDKIIGEVSKDVSKIDKGTDFSEPVSLVLHVSPATEKVRFHIDHVFIISPEMFVRYSTSGTCVRSYKTFSIKFPEYHDFLIDAKSFRKT